jgi:mRNA interferase YafQ
MREIRYTVRFKRDYRREKSGRHRKTLDVLITETVTLLAEDRPLRRRYFDHPLAGEWNDHRDCHVRPDLVLIYRKPDAKTLELVRLAQRARPVTDVPGAGRFRTHRPPRDAVAWQAPQHRL